MSKMRTILPVDERDDMNETATDRTIETENQLKKLAADGEAILRFFCWSHLPDFLQKVSEPFGAMALGIMNLPRSAERTVALRKLLESKDAAVRAAL